MKEVVKLISLLVACVLLIGLLGACQEPAEEIKIPDSGNAFTKVDALGEQIQGIAHLDGSIDNVIDNCSCLQVEFPVEVQVKGERETLTSLDDLVQIQEQYDLNPYVPDFLNVVFPMEVKVSDHTKTTITSQEELNSYAASYIEWGDDVDTECVDFEYPIEFAIYDLQNQLASTREVQDDQSLHYILGGLSKEDLISLNFPVSLIADGTTYTVQNQTELAQVLDSESAVCDENDRRYYSLEEIPLGTVSLSITDAPFPIDLIEKAEVTLTRIDVKTGTENDTVPYITLFNDTVTFDLLQLTNGITEKIGDAPIPEGTYEFFRLFVDNGTVTLTDGTVFELKVPSGNSSGIKIKPPSGITVSADQTNEYLFDFDLSRSFIPKGNPNDITKINGFNFKPVIKVSNTKDSGAINGMVTNENDEVLEGVQISLLAADTVNTTGFTNDAGEYLIIGLEPGTYVIQAELADYQLHESTDLQVTKKVTANYDFQLVQ